MVQFSVNPTDLRNYAKEFTAAAGYWSGIYGIVQKLDLPQEAFGGPAPGTIAVNMISDVMSSMTQAKPQPQIAGNYHTIWQTFTDLSSVAESTMDNWGSVLDDVGLSYWAGDQQQATTVSNIKIP